MKITWIGTLAILINKMLNSLYKVENVEINIENDIKRIGVYYMCIDDLPL